MELLHNRKPQDWPVIEALYFHRKSLFGFKKALKVPTVKPPECLAVPALPYFEKRLSTSYIQLQNDGTKNMNLTYNNKKKFIGPKIFVSKMLQYPIVITRRH